jgi:hypothetical protein
MIGVILMLVVLMSGFCYYRVGSAGRGTQEPWNRTVALWTGMLDVDAAVSGLVPQRL